MRKVIPAALIAIVALAFVVIARGKAAPPDRGNLATAFHSKYLVIYSRTKPEHGATLEKVELRKLGDRSYLVGKGINDNDPQNWYRGMTLWYPMEDIGTMIEMNDVSRMKQAAGRGTP